MLPKKKKLIAEGKLDKYGNINEQTPEDYKKVFSGDKTAPVANTNGEGEVLKKKKKEGCRT